MPDNTAWVDVESPFVAEQLVQVAAHISTRYQHRQQSLLPIAHLMGQQYATQRGNYLAFFSSFDYMEKAAQTQAQHYPDMPQWRSRAAWTKRHAPTSSPASRRTARHRLRRARWRFRRRVTCPALG
jgi:Rad3-related DNA helicase